MDSERITRAAHQALRGHRCVVSENGTVLCRECGSVWLAVEATCWPAPDGIDFGLLRIGTGVCDLTASSAAPPAELPDEEPSLAALMV